VAVTAFGNKEGHFISNYNQLTAIQNHVRLRIERHGGLENLEAGLESLRDEKRRIEVELKRLVDTIAVGNSSATVMAAINEREARLREITNQVIEPGPESLQEKLEELRTLRFCG